MYKAKKKYYFSILITIFLALIFSVLSKVIIVNNYVVKAAPDFGCEITDVDIS